jgi:uncharacterized protein (TIGR03118 family)
MAASPVAADSVQRARPHRAYHLTTLVTNLPTSAPAVQDTDVRNPWGIAFGYGANATPLWVSNEGTDTSTLYTGATGTVPQVTKVPLTVATPPSPTGVVINNDTSVFKLPNGRSSKFIFATLGGHIAGWPAPPPPPGLPDMSTTTVVTKAGGEFTGLAIGKTAGGHKRLFVADGGHGVVRVYNKNFTPIGKFTDRKARRAGLVPYNVARIGKRLFVSFEVPDGVTADVSGMVDVFKFSGHLKRRLIVGGKLEGPWGMVVAPKNWGRFGGDLLVGNEDGGRIHAYGRRSGNFHGTVRNLKGKAIANDGLWGMAFGNGVIGTPRTLIIAAGIDEYANGLIAAIRPVHRPNQAAAYSQRNV